MHFADFYPRFLLNKQTPAAATTANAAVMLLLWPEQDGLKLLLTRIGSNSKFFISGDLEQTDRYKDKKQSGLYDAITRFNYINDIGTFEFNEKDVVRNPLISKILQKYDENRD